MSDRIPRVNSLLQEEIGTILLQEIHFPDNVLVTITRVEASPNLQQAKVYISVLPEEQGEEVLQILKKDIYDIQQQINKRLDMRPVPRIIFVQEKQVKGAARVEELLEEIKKSNP